MILYIQLHKYFQTNLENLSYCIKIVSQILIKLLHKCEGLISIH